VVLLNISYSFFNLESSSVGEGSCNAGNACHSDDNLGERIVKPSIFFNWSQLFLNSSILSFKTRNQYVCLAAESGATSSITVLDNSCNEYYSCAYTSGLFNIYAMSLLLNSQSFCLAQYVFTFHLGTTGKATVSHGACTGVYAYVGLNTFMVPV
jgi:hypothetical protein